MNRCICYKSTRSRAERGQYLDADLVLHGHLHAAIVEYLGATSGKGKHFLVADLVEFDGIGAFPGTMRPNTSLRFRNG